MVGVLGGARSRAAKTDYCALHNPTRLWRRRQYGKASSLVTCSQHLLSARPVIFQDSEANFIYRRPWDEFCTPWCRICAYQIPGLAVNGAASLMLQTDVCESVDACVRDLHRITDIAPLPKGKTPHSATKDGELIFMCV